MSFNREIHHRRSIRLRNYDYSQNGLYYVTICVNKKLELFGDIIENKMKLNASGQMITDVWEIVPKKYVNVFLDEYVVMPNHFHGIIGIDNSLESEYCVGVDPCVNPD